MLSLFSGAQLLVTLWTVAHQAPLSMGFSRQEYWSGFPYPPPGDLLDPRIESTSPVSPALAGGFFTSAAATKSLQSCPTLCNPIDGSPPGSPVPGILQARTLEWVAISFSRASSQAWDQACIPCVSCIGRWVFCLLVFTTSTSWEAYWSGALSK